MAGGAAACSGVARFNGPEVVFEDIAGELGKGRLDGRLAVANGAAGLTARLRVGARRRRARRDLRQRRAPGDVRPSGVADRARRRRPQPRRVHRLADRLRHRHARTGAAGRASTRRCSAPSTRAVELGIPTEGNRIREFVTGALDNAGLPVSKASAAISINAGQARLRDIVIRADGADLQATVNVDLADAMLDALLTLNAPPSATGRGAAGRDGCAQGDAAGAQAHGRHQSADELADAARGRAAIPADRCDGAGRSRGGCRRSRRGAAMPKAAEPAEPPPAAPSLVPERAPPAPAPNATSGMSGDAGAGVAAAGHDSGGAEAACRAARRKRRAGTARRPAPLPPTRLAELTAPPAFRSGRASPRAPDASGVWLR